MLMRMANELFRLSCKAMKKGGLIKYRLSNYGVFCRVEVDGEIYELYRNPELMRNSLINFRECKKALGEIIRP